MALIASPRRYFAAYSFIVLLNDDVGRTAQLRTPRSVFADPFSGDVWIGEHHVARAPMLADHLRTLDKVHRDRGAPGIRHVDVWMIQREAVLGRVITVNFEEWRSVPLTLSAADDDAAMEWVRLVGAKYLPARDVPEPELPPAVREAFFASVASG